MQPFGDGIWLFDGPMTVVAGFRYPTRMAVIRLSDGTLFIWSPVALSGDVRAAVDMLGPVRHIVAPNALHHLFVGEWQAAYRGAKVYAPPGLRKRRPDLVFDADLDTGDVAPWAVDIDQVAVGGNLIATEIVFFHRASRTALFTDLIQHFPPRWFSGWRAIVAHADLIAGHDPAVPRKFRLAFVDRGVARAALRHILAWPIDKVLIAHGSPVQTDGSAFIARAFAWLRP